MENSQKMLPGAGTQERLSETNLVQISSSKGIVLPPENKLTPCSPVIRIDTLRGFGKNATRILGNWKGRYRSVHISRLGINVLPGVNGDGATLSRGKYDT